MNAVWFKRARWVLAGTILAAGIFLVGRGWTVCEDKVATTGPNPTVRVCRPLSVTDPPTVGVLLLVLLFLFPDLGEVGIPGFLTLKRRVEEQAAKVEEQEAKIAALTVHLTQTSEQRQTAALDASQQLNPQFVNVVDTSALLRGLHQKSDDRSDTPLLAGPDASGVPAYRAQLEAKFTRLWAKLDALLEFGRPRRRQVVVSMGTQGIGEKQTPEERRELWRHFRAHASAQDDNFVPNRIISSLWTTPGIGHRNVDAEFLRALSSFLSEKDLLESTVDMQDRIREIETNHPGLLSGGDPSESLPDILSALGKWRNDFEEELKVLEATHRAIASAQSVDDSKLRDYVTLAEGLLKTWYVRRDAVLAKARQEGPATSTDDHK